MFTHRSPELIPAPPPHPPAWCYCLRFGDKLTRIREVQQSTAGHTARSPPPCSLGLGSRSPIPWVLTHLCFPPSSPEPPFRKSKKWQTAGGMGAGLPWRGAARGGAAPILFLGDPPLSPLKASPHRKLDLPPPTSVAPSQPQKAPGNQARVPDPGSPSLLQNVCRAAASGPALGAGTSLRGGGTLFRLK